MENKILWQNKIPFLKKSKKFFKKLEYKGINLWPVMAGEIYMFQNSPIENKFEKFLMIIKFLFTMDKFNINGGKNRILVSCPIAREDHHNLIIKSTEKFPPEQITFLDNYYWKKKKSITKYVFRLPDIILLFNLWRKFKKNDMKKVFNKHYLFFLTRTYFRYKQIESLERIYDKFKPKAHIAFCSQAFAEDTILTLIAKKNKKPTFTMEHGFISKSLNFSSIQIMNENMISDYLLVWGKRNYKIAEKYIDKNKLLMVGNPKYRYNPKKTSNFNPKIVTFFFSVIGFESSNENIVKILNSFAKKHPKIQFNMSPHPFDSTKRYKQHINSKNIKFSDENVIELLRKSDFIISHNSSVAYEALLYNVPILKFKDKFTYNTKDNFYYFKDEKELEKRFTKLKNREYLYNYQKKVNKLLKENFYFEKNKEPSQVYYEKISEIIKNK